ncbi:uncharacterized protein LDX57_001298 [Aspergillus melleus]|uniref:uncharacterized protein n=1 Tax=Aspergillus melleus TaxID=138277 RepID=UPI001E8CB51F|nr:uncharacterized protein LDX57_001298 [Aspergillus melleus]KAH8423538.1 hypothetical protein LDX57_001298 [Aspergillus melleus]
MVVSQQKEKELMERDEGRRRLDAERGKRNKDEGRGDEGSKWKRSGRGGSGKVGWWGKYDDMLSGSCRLPESDSPLFVSPQRTKKPQNRPSLLLPLLPTHRC